MSKLRCPECLIRVDPQTAVCPQCGYRFRTEQFERILPFMRRPEKQWEGRLTLLQRLWGVLRIPSVAFWDIAHEPDRVGPMLIFLGNLTMISLWFMAMVYHITDATSILIYGFLGVWLIIAFLYLVLNLFYFGVIHLLVKLSGREGYFSETFMIGQYALLPFFFANTLSFLLLLGFLPPVTSANLTLLYLSPVWFIVYALASIAVLWGAILLSLGLRERYQYTTGIALVISFSVTVFVVVVAVISRLTVVPII